MDEIILGLAYVFKEDNKVQEIITSLKRDIRFLNNPAHHILLD